MEHICRHVGLDYFADLFRSRYENVHVFRTTPKATFLDDFVGSANHIGYDPTKQDIFPFSIDFGKDSEGSISIFNDLIENFRKSIVIGTGYETFVGVVKDFRGCIVDVYCTVVSVVPVTSEL